MTLRQTTLELIRAHDVAKWLRLADNYLQAYQRMPNSFVLPAEHARLKPIIDAFANNQPEFANYLREVRDGISDPGGYEDVHQLYRTVSLRHLQHTRRARLRRAVLLVCEQLEGPMGRRLTFDEQGVISRMVETSWKRLRLRAADDERRARRTGTVSIEEREATFALFWRYVEQSMDNGVVPLDIELSDIREKLK